MGNEVYIWELLSVWETDKICLKWRRSVRNSSNMRGNDNYLTNGQKMWKMAKRFGKWPKYFGNGLDI